MQAEKLLHCYLIAALVDFLPRAGGLVQAGITHPRTCPTPGSWSVTLPLLPEPVVSAQTHWLEARQPYLPVSSQLHAFKANDLFQAHGTCWLSSSVQLQIPGEDKPKKTMILFVPERDIMMFTAWDNSHIDKNDQAGPGLDLPLSLLWGLSVILCGQFRSLWDKQNPNVQKTWRWKLGLPTSSTAQQGPSTLRQSLNRKSGDIPWAQWDNASLGL